MIEVKSLRDIGKDLRVLYVEDDIKIQESMISYLKKRPNKHISMYEIRRYASRQADYYSMTSDEDKKAISVVCDLIREEGNNICYHLKAPHNAAAFPFRARHH